MTGKISLDTNIVIRLFKDDHTVTKLLSRFSTIYLPVPVAAELLFAAKNSNRPKENLQKHNDFLDACHILDITRETADHYSVTRLLLKQKGRPIPENDLWIAAICIENNLPLFTADAHFESVDGLGLVKV